MKVIWEKKAPFWPGLDIIWPGKAKYFLPFVFLIAFSLLFIFTAYIDDWNLIKTTVTFLPGFLISIIQVSRNEINKISTDGAMLLIEKRRWYWKQSELIRVAIGDITRYEFSVLLGLKLFTKKRNHKFPDSSGGDMSTALLKYLRQFDHISGLGDAPLEHAKKHLEQKIKRFTLGLDHSAKRQWYTHWVYSLDPQGFGNDLPELKDDYLQALAVILQKAVVEARSYPYPSWIAIRYVPEDMSLNALVFQDLGLKGAKRSIWIGNIDWRVQWPEDLKKAFPCRKKYICGRETTKGMVKYWVIPTSASTLV